MLQGANAEGFLARMYGNKPRAWRRELTGIMRARAVVNALTRMRYCNPKGEMFFEAKGMPGTQPPGYYPWFEVPGHKLWKTRIVFGHWSTLGRFCGMGNYGIDTGCVWGGSLTALRLDLEDPEFISVPSNRPKIVEGD
jgi:bis(5'-nucleosyl)-tetraphosphatase (symmetrical)